MKEAVFYRCPHCGNVIYMICDSGVNPVCCGEKMELLKANSVEASKEHHIPECEYDKEKGIATVKIGSLEHPTTDEHKILWIAIQTCCDIIIRPLKEDEHPCVKLYVSPECKISSVYAYCNLHGLWKKEV